MASSSRGSFIAHMKAWDRFSKPVSLTYQKKGAFSTAVGGGCTIFVLLILALIGLNNFFNSFISYEYLTSTTESLTPRN
jgi:hypothetical protein